MQAWHRLLKQAEQALGQSPDSEEAREVSLFILKAFYLQPYDTAGDFYPQFDQRRRAGEAFLAER